jgi:hypothetical protein
MQMPPTLFDINHGDWQVQATHICISGGIRILNYPIKALKLAFCSCIPDSNVEVDGLQLHTTDSNVEVDGLQLHTTDSNVEVNGLQLHTTDSNVEVNGLQLHTTGSGVKVGSCWLQPPTSI